MRRGKKVLKKLTMLYIQESLTLGYTAQTLNLFNLHSFCDVGLTHCFFFFKNTKYFNTHTGRGEKKTTNTSSIHVRDMD